MTTLQYDMKPYVICHMLTSLDGRIITTNWQLSNEGRAEYEAIGTFFNANAWMCGRVTMAAFARRPAVSNEQNDPAVQKIDYMAPGNHASFAIAIDASGRLNWQTNQIGGDHVIAVLTEEVSTDRLAALRSREVSYLFAGRDEIDLAILLDKLARKFEIKTLLLEGGGKINGSMLAAGLIDELSILIAPVTDGSIGTPTLFDVNGVTSSSGIRWNLAGIESRADGIVWLRYTRSGARQFDPSHSAA
jgi:2,5-diamino-6-(ribosylamino)-4(3H)-pyrimidinone 5'-phosphate reductase